MALIRGLAHGERIVRAGLDRLTDGMAVIDLIGTPPLHL